MSSQLRAATPWRIAPSDALTDAFRLCEALTRHHSKSFYLATALLPGEKRQAMRALYAFCRTSDDIVDEPGHLIDYSLDGWAARAHAPPSESDHPVLLAWGATRQRYALSPAVIDDLLAGVRMDLTINRYATFDDLWLYCYRVASTVGLLAMQIIGHGAGAEEYAIKLGVALQLTNILRDVGEDARRGRIYLPLEDLTYFSLTEREILDGCTDERYQRLIRYQIARAQCLYDQALPGIVRLHPDGRLAVAAAAEIYRAILPAIAANGYDNHATRAIVPGWKKLALLPRAWLHTMG